MSTLALTLKILLLKSLKFLSLQIYQRVQNIKEGFILFIESLLLIIFSGLLLLITLQMVNRKLY